MRELVLGVWFRAIKAPDYWTRIWWYSRSQLAVGWSVSEMLLLTIPYRRILRIKNSKGDYRVMESVL